MSRPALVALERHGLRPLVEKLSRTLEGRRLLQQQITGLAQRYGEFAELHGWLERANEAELQRDLADPVQRAAIYQEFERQAQTGESTPEQFRADMQIFAREADRPPTKLERTLASMDDAAVKKFATRVMRGGGDDQHLTPAQRLHLHTKVLNDGAGSKAFPVEQEHAFRQLLDALGVKQSPNLSARATILNFLSGFEEGKNIGARRRPFDGQPGLRDRERRMDMLVQRVQATPFGRAMRETGADVRHWLEEMTRAAKATDVSDELTYRRTMADVQRPRVAEPVSTSKSRLRAELEKNVAAARGGRRYEADTSTRAHILGAMNSHGVDPEFTSNATVSRDAAADVIEHTDLPAVEPDEGESTGDTSVRGLLESQINRGEAR
jgi:hypothetical protein